MQVIIPARHTGLAAPPHHNNQYVKSIIIPFDSRYSALQFFKRI